MLLKDIFLFQFKNFKDCQISDFSPKVNAIIGPNGSGKTNLLDAIYLLCFTKSAFNSIDSQLVLHGKNHFVTNGSFMMAGESYLVGVGYSEGQKKSVKVNKKAYAKLSEHIGRFPAVLISPYDQDMIYLGSEVRRKFFDAMISQYDSQYLEHLMKYNRALKHRNHVLSQFFETNSFDEVLIAPFNHRLYESGCFINERRKVFMDDFEQHFNSWLSRITDSQVSISLEYNSLVNPSDLKNHLYRDVKIDITAKRTTKGIHKDDYSLLLNEEYPLKKYGSQGQQKSCIMAMKLAQYDILKEKTQKSPLLLLDDILDKLDDAKIDALTLLISSGNTGQVFVTDANVSRVERLFSQIEEIKYFKILNGELNGM